VPTIGGDPRRAAQSAHSVVPSISLPPFPHASAVVDQIGTAFPDAERRWHDHPLIAPIKAVALFIKRSGKRIAVTIAGVAVILLGIVMLVLPGPGLLVIIAGLAILATEYVWAERLLRMAKERAIQAKDKVLRKKANGDDGTAT